MANVTDAIVYDPYSADIRENPYPVYQYLSRYWLNETGYQVH